MSQETQTVKKNPKKLKMKDELPTSNELVTDHPPPASSNPSDTNTNAEPKTRSKSSALSYVFIGGGVISVGYLIYRLNKTSENLAPADPANSESIQSEPNKQQIQPELPDAAHAKKKRKF